MAGFFESFCVAVLGFSVVNAALGGGGRSAAWRVAYAVVAVLLVMVCGVWAAAAWFGRGAVVLPVWALLGVAVAVVVNAARALGVFGWSVENRGRAAAVAAVVVVGVAFVGFGLSSGSAVDPLPAGSAPVVVSSAAVPSAAVAPVVAGLCPCDAGLVCTGQRGGRYCITAEGGKKYL